MSKPHNLLFVLSDNHGREALGSYGNPLARTPNLDALAARGVRFTAAACASPLCCPSRAAIATGLFPHQSAYWDNAIPFDGAHDSWMRRAAKAGHRVVSVGKLHFRDSRPQNGFTEERLAMHILDGKGGVHMLLRALGREPVNYGQWGLYMERSGKGETPYQAFDRAITAEAAGWLAQEAERDDKPFVLFVSYPSAHPPFSVPDPFWREDDVAAVTPPPGAFASHDDDHPALGHLRRIMNSQPIRDDGALRRVLAGYLALSAHLDAEIGTLLAALDRAGLAETTRVLYTSDHGEMAGAHGLFGKSCLYERSVGVPLILAGPHVPAGGVVDAPVSHVDLFPTILDAIGVAPTDAEPPEGETLGRSLWREIEGAPPRPQFAEYHSAGSASGSFMLREGQWKLLYHVGMPRQLFDLEADPHEERDLGPDHSQAARLEALLRAICDPEVVDCRAKSDQRRWIEHWGGADRIASEALLVYTPPPGEPAEME